MLMHELNMEGRESDTSMGESPAGRSKRLRQPVSYDEAAKDAELDQQLRASEAGRGKRQRRAVSYDHAYLTQNWDDTDFEEDEAAYQERRAKKGRPTAGLSLYEVYSILFFPSSVLSEYSLARTKSSEGQSRNGITPYR
jgi:hypothetical protein